MFRIELDEEYINQQVMSILETFAQWVEQQGDAHLQAQVRLVNGVVSQVKVGQEVPAEQHRAACEASLWLRRVAWDHGFEEMAGIFLEVSRFLGAEGVGTCDDCGGPFVFTEGRYVPGKYAYCADCCLW